MRYELADHEWAAEKPMLPNKPCGVPRINDQRVLSGIFWVLRQEPNLKQFCLRSMPPKSSTNTARRPRS
jgi:transposase